MSRIIGLDLSLTSTGYSINGKTGSISSKLNNAPRLREICNSISSLIHDHNINAAVIEGYAFSARNSQAHKIGELGGVVRLLLFDNNISYVEVPPTNRAKFATGRGNAAKSEVISAVSARTGLIWSGKSADDECDAWLLEEMALHACGRGVYDWPASHLAALSNIDWTPIHNPGGSC
jgi:crossover junction endodeoxyribonuclease RuvC